MDILGMKKISCCTLVGFRRLGLLVRQMAPCLLAIGLVQAVGVGHACTQDDQITVHSLGDQKPQPWTSLKIDRSPRDFQFAIVSDNAGSPRPGIWREAMHKLNLLQPAFVMSVGDLIEGYVDSPEDLHKQWDVFLDDLKPLERPFFFVSGNHDVGRPLWYDIYRQRIGATYYCFVYQDVLVLILDTNDGKDHSTGLSDQQLEWIEQKLQQYPATSVRWTMVFQHKPLWNEKNPQWLRIQKMLADRQKVTVMAGHIHEYMATQIDGVEYVALATTGGGSPLRGTDAGELDHVTWVTLKDNGPIVANLALDGILPMEFRTNESAKRYEELAKGKFIEVPPIQLPSGQLLNSKTLATFKNPDNDPVRLKVLFDPPEGVVVRPASITTTLEAKSQFQVELSVEADKSIPVGHLQPVVLNWQAAIDRPQQPSLQWSGVNRLFFDTLFDIPRTEPKNIDGQLSDWPELDFSVEQPGEVFTNLQAWRGRRDLRYRWAVAADDDQLYVAIDVLDDQIDHQGDMVWQDFAGVFVNPIVRPDAKLDEIKKQAFAVMSGLSMSPDDHRRYQFGNPPADVRSSVKQVANRLTYEFSIPTSRFKEVQGGDWSRLQMNVLVNDHDPDHEREGLSVIYWRPRWDGLFHYPASGLFQRAR